ncbi:MAG: hypothetical protein ACOCXG_01810, partial [Nanoarchaeota archaeon]
MAFKLKKIISGAMKTYSENPKNYDKIIWPVLSFKSKNFLFKKTLDDLQKEREERVEQQEQLSNPFEENQNQMANQASGSMPQSLTPQMQQQMMQQQVGMPGINIVSKNYISPDTLSDDDDVFEEVEDEKSKSLAKIPDNLLQKSTTDWEPINYRDVDVSYHLHDLSSVRIFFDEEEQKLLYKIIEPELTAEEDEALEILRKGFIYVFEKFSPEFSNMTEKEFLDRGTKKLCEKYKIKLDENQFKKITYFLARNFLGLEMIDPIMYDSYIEDISCDGLGVPIFVNHLKYGPLEVNRTYNDNTKLNSFIVKLAQKSNQEVSLSKPILQGALPDGSRIEAIYGKEISGKGSSFTIRKFR